MADPAPVPPLGTDHGRMRNHFNAQTAENSFNRWESAAWRNGVAINHYFAITAFHHSTNSGEVVDFFEVFEILIPQLDRLFETGQGVGEDLIALRCVRRRGCECQWNQDRRSGRSPSQGPGERTSRTCRPNEPIVPIARDLSARWA